MSRFSRSETELRPSMLRRYSDKTLSCYRARLAHYQHWCHVRGYQTGTNAITTTKLLEYVDDQITRWDDTHDQDTDAYPKYRPDTIRQTINALVFWAERSTGQAPDDRAAKQALRRFTDTFNRTHPPAWRVAGRRSPRPQRATIPRPLGDGGERP
ncbi:hypothetical protein NQK81_02590 [Amycolatopsis roodepoortensis]|uniref:hypothetical protein n=1 Tax=Amycolatopsis roodepoortensis TaxID=700274 RepID=UPI00214D04DA|nr:hypothetical protein [Amycolatopsis roodepoortensis]UUV32362.1 hypothetical protein NQK81_02590 [Amycolatopsis roodepoortensis]